MANMMDEMQKTLARRRAKVDRSSEEPDSDKQEAGERTEKSASPGKVYSGHSSQAGSESPKPGIKRGGASVDSDHDDEPGRRRHSTRGSVGGDREVTAGVREAESLMSSSTGCLASG